MATNRSPLLHRAVFACFFWPQPCPPKVFRKPHLSPPPRDISRQVALPGPQLLEGIGTLDAGDPILVAPLVYGSGGYIPSSVWIADLNHDGKLDLVLANACNSVDECGQGNVSVLLGNGDGTFQTAVAYRHREYLRAP